MRTSSILACLVLLASWLAAQVPARGQGPAPVCTTPVTGPSCTSPVGGDGCNTRCGRPDCPVCCQPPCEGVPRRGQPRRGQPREAAGPVGNYVAPPPTGTVEGAQRGVEVGSLAITFPELTIGLPKLRLTGCSLFQRGGRMQLDSAAAPFVENPLAALQTQPRGAEEEEETTSRGAEEKEKTTPREAKQPCAQQPWPQHPCAQPVPPRSATEQETSDRLDRLEQCIQQQNEAILRCLEQLKQARQSTAPISEPVLRPKGEPLPAPGSKSVGKLYPTWPAQPPAPIRPAQYLEPIPVPHDIVRLPPITAEN